MKKGDTVGIIEAMKLMNEIEVRVSMLGSHVAPRCGTLRAGRGWQAAGLWACSCPVGQLQVTAACCDIMH